MANESSGNASPPTDHPPESLICTEPHRLIGDVEYRSLPVDVAQPDIHITGMNGALKRAPKVEARPVPLLNAPGFVPSWKPFWPKVKTVGLTFPEGIEFLPPKKEPSEEEGLRKIAPPKKAAGNSEPKKKKPTRVKPPSDALSLQDRLFYVLQPPLETWLKGQELIMPFEPFPYQYEGIAWLFAQKSALLADEMGLGKTMQTITAVRLLLRSGQVRRVLMVCPKPLIPNWQREFKLWAEEIPVTTIDGDGPRRRMIWQMPGSLVLLANYELVVRDFQEMLQEQQPEGPDGTRGLGLVKDGLGRPLRAKGTSGFEPELPKFDLVVLDEAQRIKNRDSLTSTIARAIPRKRSLCLTGTPIENRPEEMVSLFEFMGTVPPGATPDIRQLSRLSEDCILRRTKDLVMKDMPPRLDRDEIIELAPAQKLAYEQAEKDGVVQLNDMGESITIQHVFELVLRLKQIANYDPLTGESAKLDRLVADMEEISASGGKAILFSQWTKSLDWMAPKLAPFNPLIYHGGIPTKKREPILTRFKEDPDAHILLMSYGTGAVGLNLQFAGYVFLYDRWWNPAVEDQAINRAHRIGCKSQVIVSKFICKDTIEERIDLVLKQKRELFQRVLGEGDNENASLSLSAGEIFGLFDLKARDSDGGATPIGPKKADAA
ncbi:ATP-dependent helicase HepA [Maioricimonas rarisocia]|uniref:ATP-dependent helicase HepA n=1 Tax=Maioricimonas rarisocia TaxID=2528026 RepID=A0A517ZDT0_9PLAN|nr:DEAD/DEAH box helicase [Maioricimonas rarisocia]QDU40625.1 ATP-dependent helicase HepA [Maioricimonas rarisocia]